MPGLKISKVDRDRIDAKFICTKCNFLLNEPMQTSCGHLMCKTCFQEVLSSSNPICPKDGTKLIKQQSFPDAFTKRELMGLRLKCQNIDCDWSGSYKELHDHSNCCGHSLIQCVHDQCKKEIKRSLLAQHLEQECNYRLVSCTYCKEELAFISLDDHVAKSCPLVPVTCEHCGTSGIPRREMNKHELMECEEVLVECEFKAVGCNHIKVAKRRELRQHLSDRLVLHLQLLLNFVLVMFGKFQDLVPKVEISTMMQTALEELKQLIGSLSAEVKSQGEKFASMLTIITGLQRRVDKLESGVAGSERSSKTVSAVKTVEAEPSDLRRRLERLEEMKRKLEDELREKTSIIERLSTKVDQLDHSMALTTVKLSDMETTNAGQPPISYNGTLLWKIDDFKRKRQDAINGVQNAIYSPSFYSNQFGYKMCARIYMNGDGFGKGTHISLFFVVMMGEYDALLPWPFQKRITMMLMDQVTGDHMTDAFRSDPDSSSFQRPKTKMNIASGSPLFMPLDSLNNRAYVRDDAIFIKIIVDS